MSKLGLHLQAVGCECCVPNLSHGLINDGRNLESKSMNVTSNQVIMLMRNARVYQKSPGGTYALDQSRCGSVASGI